MKNILWITLLILGLIVFPVGFFYSCYESHKQEQKESNEKDSLQKFKTYLEIEILKKQLYGNPPLPRKTNNNTGIKKNAALL